ncbi:MAG: hypothetical protein AAF560_02355 [Acidobacteriota bacterium]
MTTHAWTGRDDLPPTVGLVATTLAVYWGIWHQPFVGDDWLRLYALETQGWAAVPAAINGLFFRPAAELYLWAAHHLFGLNPALYHLLALALHAVNGLLVVSVLQRLTHAAWLAWGTGYLYVAASTVHLEPLGWIVGIYELGSVLFLLLAVRWFIVGRVALSAVAYFVALLFKESVLLLPGVLLVWRLETRSRRLSMLNPHLLVMLGYLGWRVARVLEGTAPSPFALDSEHPYAVSLWGPHLVDNATTYAGWALQAFLPWSITGRFTPLIAVAALAVGVVFLTRQRRQVTRSLPTLGTWVLVMFGPLLTLPNHAFRYYLSPALPAILALGVWVAGVLWARRETGPRLEILIPLLVFAIASSLSHAQRTHRVIGPPWLADGTSHLFDRGRTVLAAEAELRQWRSRWLAGSNLVFSGVDVWAFGRDAGPRIWLDDPTLEVFDARYVERRDGGLVAVGQPETLAAQTMAEQAGAGQPEDNHHRALDPERTVFLDAGDLGL